MKINLFASFKNIRISLYILYRDFQIHFSIDFAILLKLPFCIENQYKFFYWKSIDFCQQHFLPKIYTKFSIGFTVHFELAILYWKLIQMFPLKIDWFLSASFSYWKSIQNLPLIKTLSCIRIGRSMTFFYWFCYIFEIIILYWKSTFQMKINWFASFKNFGISLISFI